MINREDIELFSTGLPFWEHLNQSEKDLLLTNANSAHFSKGQALHYSDNECIGILFIKHGMIRIYITSDEGREVTLYRLEDNDICILSASCVLQNIDFDIYIEAETDCDIIQISSIIFSKLSSKNAYVELFSYKLATERFSEVMWAMQQILFTSFDKRLAAFLIDETIKSKSNNVNLTHEQIAKYLGSAREVVSRMLKYFEKEGYVTLFRGGITINNKKALQSILK